MSFCSFAENAGMFDVTPIENMFLLEYLPTAPGKYMRVYLYGRMVCLHPELGNSMEDMAKTLHLEVDEIEAALDFWERQGLVMRMSDRPPTYAFIPMRGGPATFNPMESNHYEFQELHNRLRALFPEEELHAKQFVMVEDWIKIFHFEEAAVVRMVQAAVERSRSRQPNPYRIFDKVNDNAIRWSQKYDGQVITLEMVEIELANDARIKKTISAVMKQLGMDNRKASLDEIKLVDHWLNDLELTHDEIIGACAETTKSRTPTLGYLNSVLESRRRGDSEMFGGLKEALAELGAGNRPTPAQIESYGKMLALGFEAETIHLAAVECNRENKHNFEDLRQKIKEWMDLSLFRADAARAYVVSRETVKAETMALLKKCGFNRAPRGDEMNYYERWRAVYAAELIAYAAECARGMQVPMRYIDKLLGEWAKGGITTADAARAQHEARRSQKPAGGQAAANPALNYDESAHYKSASDSIFLNVLKNNGGDKA